MGAVSDKSLDAEQWFQPSAPSGNVQDARLDGDDLVVRFRSGETYRYPGQGGMMAALLGSPSPGRFVWRHLRAKKAVKL